MKTLKRALFIAAVFILAPALSLADRDRHLANSQISLNFSPPEVCAELLKDSATVFNNLQPIINARETLIMTGSVENQSTVTHKKTIADLDGGHRFVLERKGASWFSNYRLHKNDPQYDPRATVTILGPQTGFTLGFAQLREFNFILAPAYDRLNIGIEKLNFSLRKQNIEPINVRFYPQNSQELETDKNLLDQFAFHLAIPIGAAGHLAIHDLAAHAPSLALPPKIVTAFADQLHFLSDFESWVREEKKMGDLTFFSSQQQNEFLHIASSRLDFSLGDLNRYLYQYFNQSMESAEVRRYMVADGYYRLNLHVTPEDVLRNELEYMNFSEDKINELINGFKKDLRAKKQLDAFLRPSLELSPTEFVDAIFSRIQTLSQISQ